MANTTIDQLASLAAADVANTDLLLIYDGSAVIEKQLSISDLRTAVYASGPVVGSNSFTVSGTGNSDVFIVTSTDSTAASAPDVILYRNSASPAASDLLGEITFRGKNSANAVNKYAAISSSIVSPTAAAEGGHIIFSTMTDGTIAERMRIRDDGGIGIGSAGIASSTLRIDKNITGGVSQTVIRNDGDIQSDVTTAVYMNRTIPGVANTAFTLNNLYHYSAAQGAIGSAASVTNQYGFVAEASLIGATGLNVGFAAVAIPSANVTSGKTVRAIQTNHDIATGGGTSYNLYINGTAPSYFEGSVGFGSTAPDAAARLQIDSTTQGFLPPRMNPTQRGNISSPPAGLMIYNSTTNKLNFYNGTAWEAVTSA